MHRDRALQYLSSAKQKGGICRCVEVQRQRLLDRRKQNERHREGERGCASFFSELSLSFSLPLSTAYLLGRHGSADGHGDARADGAGGAVDLEMQLRKTKKGRAMSLDRGSTGLSLFLSLSRFPKCSNFQLTESRGQSAQSGRVRASFWRVWKEEKEERRRKRKKRKRSENEGECEQRGAPVCFRFSTSSAFSTLFVPL